MTVKRAIFYTLASLLVLALPLQVMIDASIENIASVCLVLASSLSMLLYLGWSDALDSQPLSTFAIFGFCVTTQLGALLIQTAAWTALRSSLYDSLYTFGTVAFYQAIAIAVHIGYRFFSRPKPSGSSLFRGVFSWAGLYKTPSAGALWLIGFVGLVSYLVFVRESIYFSVVGKIGMAFNFLAWAPFLIPIYLREVGESYCNWKRNRWLLIAYTVTLCALGVALNTRGVMFFGVATVGLLYLLGGMRNRSLVTGSALAKAGVLAVVVLALSGPISDLVTAMAIARGLGKVPVSVKIERTFIIWQRPDLIAIYRTEHATASLYLAYDDYYIANPILTRFVLTKFYDNALHFAGRISTEDAKARLRDVSWKFAWAVLPAPVLGALGVRVEKLDLNYSMGDYLPYLSRGTPLGGHRVGSMFGQGIALFGPLFPLVYALICLCLFGLMDLLTVRRAAGMATVSSLGMLQIWNYFINGLSFEALHQALNFMARNFEQTVLIYAVVFGMARLITGKKGLPNDLSKKPPWQRSLGVGAPV